MSVVDYKKLRPTLSRSISLILLFIVIVILKLFYLSGPKGFRAI